jgi:hypothetical protein
MKAISIRNRRSHRLEILYFVVLVIAFLVLTSLTLPV